MKADPKLKNKKIFIQHFVGGLGWMAGATIGFTLFVTVLSLFLNWLGGLPVIGNFFANLIEVTNQALEAKKTFPR
jgi:NO-binding membrane sensor protein with MHYT domain